MVWRRLQYTVTLVRLRSRFRIRCLNTYPAHRFLIGQLGVPSRAEFSPNPSTAAAETAILRITRWHRAQWYRRQRISAGSNWGSQVGLNHGTINNAFYPAPASDAENQACALRDLTRTDPRLGRKRIEREKGGLT